MIEQKIWLARRKSFGNYVGKIGKIGENLAITFKLAAEIYS